MTDLKRKASYMLWLAFIILPFCALSHISQAQEKDEVKNLYQWAYSATFGTGFYLIGGEEVFVFRVAPELPLSTSEDNKFSLELGLPVTIGVQISDLDKILEDYLPDRFQTISFVPGLSLTTRINSSWTLRPYFHFGWGTEIIGSNSAFIYYSGVNSRYMFHYGRSDFGLLNAVQFQGYDPNHGEKDSFFRLINGLEWYYPLGDLALKGKQIFISPHFAHYWYFGDLKFLYINDEPIYEIKQEFEFGVSLVTKKKVVFWLFSFDRVGLAYIISDNKNGLRFMMRSIF